MSWFIFSYSDLAEFVSAARRLDDFRNRIQETRDEGNRLSLIRDGGNTLETQGLTLTSPHGHEILPAPDFRIRAGETVWLRGCSGRGKSTLIKALAGLWRHGQGRIVLPSGKAFFLPQHAYLPLGDLRTAAVYPARLLAPGETPPAGEAAFSHNEADALLARVGLAGRGDEAVARGPDRDGAAAAHGLSGGELQRLMLARVLAAQPDWVFLDEATSALDAEAEHALLKMIRDALPDATMIVIAHRAPLMAGRLRKIDLTHGR